MEFGKNIFGVGEFGNPSCNDSDGNACTGPCCKKHLITHPAEVVVKPANTWCPHHIREQDNDVPGYCAAHEDQPWLPCEAYHCGYASPAEKRDLLNYALENGFLSAEVVGRALARLEEFP